jgi:hypothetical protein
MLPRFASSEHKDPRAPQKQDLEHVGLLKWVRRRASAPEAQRPNTTQPQPSAPWTQPLSRRQARASSGTSPDAYWLPAGSPVTVGGYAIPGGQVYIGRGLPAVRRGWQPEPEPAPTGTPPTTATTLPASVADRIRAAAQDELGPLGEVTAVQAEPGGRVTVTWEITEAATTGLTKNYAKLGVLRIMSAVKQVEAGVGDDYRDVRLLGRFRLPGGSEPATVVRLRFAKSTVQRTDFIDTRYLEAYEPADAATIQQAHRG